MITDALLNFVPIGSPLTVTSAAVASGVVDLSGAGLGVTPPSIWGAPTATGQTPTVFGSPDAMGVGGPRPELNVTLGSLAWVSGTSLTVALQGAIDNGSNQPSTWNTFVESGAIATANLTANLVIFRCPWLPPFPASLRPRFLRLLFTPVGTFTVGTIASALDHRLFATTSSTRYAAKSLPSRVKHVQIFGLIRGAENEHKRSVSCHEADRRRW